MRIWIALVITFPVCGGLLSRLGSRAPGLSNASQYPRLRPSLSRIPLADALALQHRLRCVRPLGRARARSPRNPARACRRHDRAFYVWLAARDLEPAREYAGGV